MRYLSVCSGIEAASVAWEPLGWTPVLFSEIERFPRSVLRYRQRAWNARHGVRDGTVPLWGDFTTIRRKHLLRLRIDATIDLLVGGTPCQPFSVAGLRAGMADPRGSLALQFLVLARRLRPRWLVWENVPGVLSSNGGRDFGAFLGGLAELGYGWAYRILDAQYFGVPQRRRRVFVVGYLGDWRRAAAVLFERHSLQGHSPPRREAGERSAPTLAARTQGGGGLGTDFDCDGGLIASTGDISHCPNAGGMGRQDYETETLIAHTLRADGFDASEDGTGRGTPLVPIGFYPTGGTHGVSHVYDAGDQSPTIAFQDSQSATRTSGTFGTLDANYGPRRRSGVLGPMAVRRITPREAERLQGFPDDYTKIPLRRSKRGPSAKMLAKYPDLYELGADGIWTHYAADGPRYKALGNSMAVVVMEWIGQRIQAVEDLTTKDAEARWVNF